jgi:hypothetical protein
MLNSKRCTKKKKEIVVFLIILSQRAQEKHLKPYDRVAQTLPLADPFRLRKKKKGSLHPCSRKYRVSGQQVSKIKNLYLRTDF